MTPILLFQYILAGGVGLIFVALFAALSFIFVRGCLEGHWKLKP